MPNIMFLLIYDNIQSFLDVIKIKYLMDKIIIHII